MSKPSNYGPSFDAQDAFSGFLDLAAKICFYGGALATVASAGMLIFYFHHFLGVSGSSTVSMASPAELASAANLIELFSKVLIAGAVAGALGSTFLFWGEETMHGIQLIIAALLVFSPIYLPIIFQVTDNLTDTSKGALAAVQKGGIVLGVLSLIALLAELGLRIRVRAMQGSRTEHLRYGKGIKEERYQNKFLGKCWQLPYCRKFVREKCPIFLSKRTCWKERVGCMCEEEVIRNAMENRPIPKDAIAAAKYIPVNNKITSAQKRERCRQCVIFNEHLKHQYRLMLPITIVGFALIYVLFKGPMMAATGALIEKFNAVVSTTTMNTASGIQGSSVPFQEILLDCFMVVLLAYVLKILEYVIFKLKI